MGSNINHLTYLPFQGRAYTVNLKLWWSPNTLMNFISVSNKQKYNSGIEKAEWPQIILIYKELTMPL